MHSAEVGWWHIAWATFLAWPPTDERGDWRELASLYAKIAVAGGLFSVTELLPTHWQGQKTPVGHVTLPAAAFDQLAEALRELATTDRIAGGTPVAAIAVAPTWVQMVLRCSAANLSQRVGRLKSRSATLLSFKPELCVGGVGTWGRGFWRAELLNETAISMASAFVRAVSHTSPLTSEGSDSGVS